MTLPNWCELQRRYFKNMSPLFILLATAAKAQHDASKAGAEIAIEFRTHCCYTCLFSTIEREIKAIKRNSDKLVMIWFLYSHPTTVR